LAGGGIFYVQSLPELTENHGHHPEGIVVDIVSIEESNRGRSCECHPVCVDHLNLDCIVRLRKVQIVTDDGRE
jgi:hypothetical protein